MPLIWANALLYLWLFRLDTDMSWTTHEIYQKSSSSLDGQIFSCNFYAYIKLVMVNISQINKFHALHECFWYESIMVYILCQCKPWFIHIKSMIWVLCKCCTPFWWIACIILSNEISRFGVIIMDPLSLKIGLYFNTNGHIMIDLNILTCCVSVIGCGSYCCSFK